MNATIIREGGQPVVVSLPPLSGNVTTGAAQERLAVEDFLLGSLQHPSVRLRRELRLKVRREPGTGVTIEWPEAVFSVTAPSFQSAVDLFRRKLAEEFSAKVEASNLSPIIGEALRKGRA